MANRPARSCRGSPSAFRGSLLELLQVGRGGGAQRPSAGGNGLQRFDGVHALGIGRRRLLRWRGLRAGERTAVVDEENEPAEFRPRRAIQLRQPGTRAISRSQVRAQLEPGYVSGSVDARPLELDADRMTGVLSENRGIEADPRRRSRAIPPRNSPIGRFPFSRAGRSLNHSTVASLTSTSSVPCPVDRAEARRPSTTNRSPAPTRCRVAVTVLIAPGPKGRTQGQARRDRDDGDQADLQASSA